MTDDYAELADSLEPIEADLLRGATQADEVGATMLARLLETWAHSLAMARADLSNTERPGTLPNYLRSAEAVVDGYDLTERLRPDAAPRDEFGTSEDDGEPRTDGGREFTTQPETCPECGMTLDANGECRTGGCPGPESDG